MLGAVRQQAITWAHVDSDLCCHMVSLGHDELTQWPKKGMCLKVWECDNQRCLGEGYHVCKIVVSWMLEDLDDDRSTMVQVMAWWCQATSHNLNQCWLYCMKPYSITRGQWVNLMAKAAETMASHNNALHHDFTHGHITYYILKNSHWQTWTYCINNFSLSNKISWNNFKLQFNNSGYQIATIFCTCHDSIAVMACAKFCGNHLIKIRVILNNASLKIQQRRGNYKWNVAAYLVSLIMPDAHRLSMPTNCIWHMSHTLPCHYRDKIIPCLIMVKTLWVAQYYERSQPFWAMLSA